MISGTVLESLSSVSSKKLDPMPKKSFLMPFCDQNGKVYFCPGLHMEYWTIPFWSQKSIKNDFLSTESSFFGKVELKLSKTVPGIIF